jgi:hypothetical protein
MKDRTAARAADHRGMFDNVDIPKCDAERVYTGGDTVTVGAGECAREGTCECVREGIRCAEIPGYSEVAARNS